MAESDRPTVLKRLREIKELADAAYWGLLDLRILLKKTEAGLTEAESGSGEPHSGVLGEVESHEDYQPGDSENGASS